VKKVLVITYYFPPSGGAGVQRWLKMMKFLPEFGVEPIVLTVDAKYASYPQYDPTMVTEIPTGLLVYKTKSKEILSVYKKVSPNHQIPYGGFANEPQPTLFQKIARFIRGNFFLPDPRRGWNKYAYKEACKIIEEENISTVITTSPPHSTQLIGLKLKKKYPGIQWIADLRDPWTDIYYNKDLYQLPWARKWNERYEKKVLTTADKIITVSDDCAKLFRKKVTPEPFVFVIPNGYDPDDFDYDYPIPNPGKKVLSYVGVFSPQYRIDVLINGLKLVSHKWADKLTLRFVGVVNQEAKERLDDLLYDVEYVDYVSHKKAVAYMRASDMLLLCIPDIPNNRGILTGKLFEYLATQKPILLIGPALGDAAFMVEKSEMGTCSDYDPWEVANFIDQLMSGDFQYSPTQYYQQFSRRTSAQRLAVIIKSL
jgi:glycosyltransferase involved in cell wall biosynthesis